MVVEATGTAVMATPTPTPVETTIQGIQNTCVWFSARCCVVM